MLEDFTNSRLSLQEMLNSFRQKENDTKWKCGSTKNNTEN